MITFDGDGDIRAIRKAFGSAWDVAMQQHARANPAMDAQAEPGMSSYLPDSCKYGIAGAASDTSAAGSASLDHATVLAASRPGPGGCRVLDFHPKYTAQYEAPASDAWHIATKH